MRIVPITVIGIFAFAAFRIFTDVTTKQWTGTAEKMCVNVTDSVAAAQKNFSIACGNQTFTMRRHGEWTPEFRRLSSSALADLYHDRPFHCKYAYVMVDTWYARPVLTETYRDCHQAVHEQPNFLGLRLRRFT